MAASPSPSPSLIPSIDAQGANSCRSARVPHSHSTGRGGPSDCGSGGLRDPRRDQGDSRSASAQAHPAWNPAAYPGTSLVRRKGHGACRALHQHSGWPLEPLVSPSPHLNSSRSRSSDRGRPPRPRAAPPGAESGQLGDGAPAGPSQPAASGASSPRGPSTSLGPSLSTISAAGTAAAAAAAAVLKQSSGGQGGRAGMAYALGGGAGAQGADVVDDTWEPTALARRVAIWGSLLFISLQLKDFSGIFMGTLVLSVVGNAVVESLLSVLPGRRRLLVTAMYTVTVALLVTMAVTRLPGAYQDCVDFLQMLQRTDLYSAVFNSLRSQFGYEVTEQLESFLVLAVGKQDSALVGIPTAQQRTQALQGLLKRYSGQLLAVLAASLAATSRFLLQSIISLILSCMIVWDLPKLSSSLSSLGTSRIAPFYNEIAPAVLTFGRIFRRALSAQSTVAVLNTALTLLGMLVLQVDRVVALSGIVFLCSFVPVAGVIISTVPIGVVALYEGGLVKVAFVVLMVVLIHAIEAYILNPFIYSAHLKLHPILTLGVLVVSEHVFGVWGLVTAVPLAVFLVDYVIYRKQLEPQEALE